jgi:L-cysteine:1D-myo-inositol 2-amino-2-deoxy-alpha-D-glucopyranoside ligase
MVGYDGEKMSKSRGNLVLVSTLRRDGVDPMAIRLALLAHDHRTDWEWHVDELVVAQRRLARWREAFATASGTPAGAVIDAVRGALADGLRSPDALRAVDAWVDGGGGDQAAPAAVALAVDALLGVV